MMKIKQKILYLGVMLLIASFVGSIIPQGAAYAGQPGGTAGNNARTQCTSRFLTFPAWYRGVINESNCAIQNPAKYGFTKFFIKIGLNIIEMLLQIVAYVSIAFVLYGGFLYLTSAGNPEQTASGRKTILNAVIGLVLSFFSVAIVTLVAGNIK